MYGFHLLPCDTVRPATRLDVAQLRRCIHYELNKCHAPTRLVESPPDAGRDRSGRTAELLGECVADLCVESRLKESSSWFRRPERRREAGRRRNNRCRPGADVISKSNDVAIRWEKPRLWKQCGTMGLVF